MNTINAGAFNLNPRQVSSTQANQQHTTQKTVEEHDTGTQKFKEAIESILKQQGMEKTDKVKDQEVAEAIIEELSQLLNMSKQALMQLDELNFKRIKGTKESNLLTLVKTESQAGKEILNIVFGDVKNSSQGIEDIAKISLKHNEVKSQDSTQQLNTVINELKTFNASIDEEQFNTTNTTKKLVNNHMITFDQTAETVIIDPPEEIKTNIKAVEKNFENLLKSIKQSSQETSNIKKVDQSMNLQQVNEQSQKKAKDQENKALTLEHSEDKAAKSQASTKKVTAVKLEENKVNQQTDESVMPSKAATTKPQTSQQQATKFKTLVQNNNVMKQINEQVEIKTLANKNEIEIKLKPDALGKMKITLSSESSKMAAKILVENTTVQQYLENNLTDLKSTLAAKGISVDQLSIETENKSSNDQYNQNANHNFNQFDQDQRHSRNNNRRLYYQQFNNNEMVDGELEMTEMNPWQANEYYSRGFEYFA